jgi:ATP-dependent RNA helicase SUPV3L1/SUV3
MALEAPADVEGPARGIAFQLFEHLGLLPRGQVSDEVKGLDQDVRGKMRKLGIKFGAYHIYLPLSLKPAPRELALILFALRNGGIRQPGVTDIPHIVLSGRTSFLVDPEVDPRLYEIAGFKVAGKRAVRVDILERLADIIRPLIAIDPTRFQGEPPAGAAEGNGFRVTVEMTSLLGCSGEDFASILTSLGYRVRRTPKAVAPAAEASAEAPALDAVLADNPAEVEAPAEESPVAEAEVETPAVAEGIVDEAQSAEAAVPAEPEFDEIWFPGGRRHNENNHNGRRQGNRRPEGAEGGEAKTEGRGRPDRSRPKGPRRPEGERPAANGNGKSGGNGRPRNEERQRPDKGDRQDRRPVREERKVAFDPDSPFAALAALRGKTE